MSEKLNTGEARERLEELYTRNDQIERELNRNLKTKDEPRKTKLLNELQEVIDEIERLEDEQQQQPN